MVWKLGFGIAMGHKAMHLGLGVSENKCYSFCLLAEALM